MVDFRIGGVEGFLRFSESIIHLMSILWEHPGERKMSARSEIRILGGDKISSGSERRVNPNPSQGPSKTFVQRSRWTEL